MWNVKTNWKECIVSRCSVVVGCVTLHRTSETNLLVGVNFSPSLSLSLSLFLSFSLYLHLSICISYLFLCFVYWHTRSLVFVFSFALSHSCSLSCMRTCHRFRDRYYELTETNLSFQAIRGHNDPEYRQIILRSCYRTGIHSEIFLSRCWIGSGWLFQMLTRNAALRSTRRERVKNRWFSLMHRLPYNIHRPILISVNEG